MTLTETQKERIFTLDHAIDALNSVEHVGNDNHGVRYQTSQLMHDEIRQIIQQALFDEAVALAQGQLPVKEVSGAMPEQTEAFIQFLLAFERFMSKPNEKPLQIDVFMRYKNARETIAGPCLVNEDSAVFQWPETS